jgi:two-component system cell cycle sensor histidine kinase/response regulator CckA
VSIQALSADGAVLVWNRASERLFGWPAEEVLGRRRPDGLVPPEEELASSDRMRRALQGEPVHGERVRRRTRDGRERILEVYAGPMTDDGGAAVGVASHMVDVTEREALEAQLRQQQKMEAIGQLSGGVAHDFNNMLTAIRGHAELARAGADPADAELLEDLAEIVRSADRASDLTRQLLAFARKSPVDPRGLDPGSAVREIAPMLRRLLGERVHLELEVDPAAGRVRADRAQLDQLVLNLAVNARDAMPDGGRLVISVRDVAAEGRAGSQGRCVEIAVSDTGIGMDEATRARIFEPFFTTKAPGSGTGMGLATVFGIVSMADGSVSVDSAPGAGSTFRVLLPRVHEEPEHREQAVGQRAQGGSETVLLVEDEPAVRALVGLGYRVIEAGRGDDALAAADAHPGHIALLVTDVVLPGMQGPELAELLALRRPGMAVLFCSGYNELDAATLALGGRRYLP